MRTQERVEIIKAQKLRGRYKWQILDKRFRFNQQKLKSAKKLGYECISEAIIKEYRKLKSARKVGEMIGMTSNGVRFALKAFGENVAGPGGYRKGDIRLGRPKSRNN
jgi:hypothetical protein